MRTTLTIDDDILEAVRERADFEQKTIGEVLSSLARSALVPPPAPATVRNGVPQLPVQPGARPVTLEFVNRLRDELL
jgi:hypothetical protein